MNYDNYYLSFHEWLRMVGAYLLIDILISYLFYDSIYSFFILLPGVIWYLRNKKKEEIRKRQGLLKQQFMDMILALSGKVSTGMSAENAIISCLDDMTKLHGAKSLIVTELRSLEISLSNNHSLEGYLLDLGRRSGIEDINEFAQVFIIAKRGGGEMKRVILETVRMMQEKQDTEAEIAVMVSGKQLEQKIMCFIPLLMIAFLKYSASEFLSVMYHNPFGITIMSVCLVIFIWAFVLAKKIVNIEV